MPAKVNQNYELMKKFIWIAFYSLLIIPMASAQADVRRLEQERFAAQLAQDTLQLARLLSDQLRYVHSNALEESKTDFIRSVATGSIRYLSMEQLSALDYVRAGRFILLSGIVAVEGLYSGSPFSIKLRYSSWYKKERGMWRLYYWQSTKIP
jgi:hypothetical protein